MQGRLCIAGETPAAPVQAGRLRSQGLRSQGLRSQGLRSQGLRFQGLRSQGLRSQAGRGKIAAVQINPHLAGALAYVIGPLALVFARKHPMVRFHSLQASLLALSLVVLNLSLSVLLAAIYRESWHAGVKAEVALSWLYRAQFVLWLVMVYSGYELEKVRLPWVGKVAEQL